MQKRGPVPALREVEGMTLGEMKEQEQHEKLRPFPRGGCETEGCLTTDGLELGPLENGLESQIQI